MANKTNVAALMTAESIIVVFLFAYAPVVGQMLVYWSERGGPLFTTVATGLLIYGLVLTAFRSILLLFKSIDTDDPCNEKYRAGYDLFLAVIFGSSIFIVINVMSILSFPNTGRPWNIPASSPLTAWAIFFFILWVLLVWLCPIFLSQQFGCVRRKLREWFGWWPF